VDSIATTPAPRNEPVRNYAPGSAERASLTARLAELSGQRFELTQTIDGEQRLGGLGPPSTWWHRTGTATCSARSARPPPTTRRPPSRPRCVPPRRGASCQFEARAAVLLRAADLLSGPWRDTLNAATMLGQSKTAIQAEIDSACELADFWRYNVHFARRILAEQPESSPGVWNRMDHRPLEGFVYRDHAVQTSPRSPATCPPPRR